MEKPGRALRSSLNLTSDIDRSLAVHCDVILVTHNSQCYFDKCMQALLSQTCMPRKIIVVDSGSNDISYLHTYADLEGVQLIYKNENVGFCHANNLGWENVSPDAKYVLFLNPDAFIKRDYISDAIALMEKGENLDVAGVTGITLGYDIVSDAPTGLYDSTGIFQTWWGKWYDRGQGQKVSEARYFRQEWVPAICGAIYFCRREALESVLIAGKAVFDPGFYMYKEDIDLSLRFRRKGWKLLYEPSLIAYHCRGWAKIRAEIPKVLRQLSAKNELSIHRRHHLWTGMVYSWIKYYAVKFLNA